jgi:hypothetical protein
MNDEFELENQPILVYHELRLLPTHERAELTRTGARKLVRKEDQDPFGGL